MKKLIALIIAAIVLVGCTPAEPAETIQINYEPQGGTTELEIDASKTKLQYPKSLHLEVMRLPNKEPRVYVKFAEEYLSNGTISDFIRLTVQASNYEEFMAEEWDAPYFPLQNPCKTGDSPLGEIFGCETANGVTSYYQISKQVETVLAKKFFVETGSADWPLAEMRVDLTDDNATEDSFKALELNDDQKRKMQIAEDMLVTLTVK